MFRKEKRSGMETRDYSVVPVAMRFSFQTNTKQIPSNHTVVEFRNLPKLKKVKDTRKFRTVLLCKFKQCCWISPPPDPDKLDTATEGELKSSLEDFEFAPNKKARRAKKQAETQELRMYLGLPTKTKGARKDELLSPKKAKRRMKKRLSKIQKKDGNARAYIAKVEVLEELCAWFKETNFRPVFDDGLVKGFLEMVSCNLFRPLNDPKCPHVRVKASTSRCHVDVVDDPSPEWHVLALIHRLFAALLLGCKQSDSEDEHTTGFHRQANTHKALLLRHLTKRWLSRYVDMLRTGDDLEREFMTMSLILLYDTVEDLQRVLRQIIANAVHSFITDPELRRPATAGTQIRSLLNVSACVITRFGSLFLQWVLLPLYLIKIDCLQRYHQELFKCVTLFISRQHSDAVPVFRKLVKSWPRQSAFKQLLFLDQIHAAFLQIVQHRESTEKLQLPVYKQWFYTDQDRVYINKMLIPLFKQICECIEGAHYDVSQAAVKIIDHPAVFFPLILYPNKQYTDHFLAQNNGKMPASPSNDNNNATTTPDKLRVPTHSPSQSVDTRTLLGKPEFPPRRSMSSPQVEQLLIALYPESPRALEFNRNPLLPLVYATFRRCMPGHAYIDVRRTLDTLMGLMENEWPLLCELCVQCEDAREQAARFKLQRAIILEHEREQQQILSTDLSHNMIIIEEDIPLHDTIPPDRTRFRKSFDQEISPRAQSEGSRAGSDSLDGGTLPPSLIIPAEGGSSSSSRGSPSRSSKHSSGHSSPTSSPGPVSPLPVSPIVLQRPASARAYSSSRVSPVPSPAHKAGRRRRVQHKRAQTYTFNQSLMRERAIRRGSLMQRGGSPEARPLSPRRKNSLDQIERHIRKLRTSQKRATLKVMPKHIRSASGQLPMLWQERKASRAQRAAFQVNVLPPLLPDPNYVDEPEHTGGGGKRGRRGVGAFDMGVVEEEGAGEEGEEDDEANEDEEEEDDDGALGGLSDLLVPGLRSMSRLSTSHGTVATDLDETEDAPPSPPLRTQTPTIPEGDPTISD